MSSRAGSETLLRPYTFLASRCQWHLQLQHFQSKRPQKIVFWTVAVSILEHWPGGGAQGRIEAILVLSSPPLDPPQRHYTYSSHVKTSIPMRAFSPVKLFVSKPWVAVPQSVPVAGWDGLVSPHHGGGGWCVLVDAHLLQLGTRGSMRT